MENKPVTLEAHEIVNGPRQQSYGHPRKNFEQTAKIWSAILEVEVTAEQVGLCMIGVKLSRQCHSPKRDNLVDIAGYSETLNMLSGPVEPAIKKPAEPAITWFKVRCINPESSQNGKEFFVKKNLIGEGFISFYSRDLFFAKELQFL